jgi:2-C-methyl-D-erythritol 4-phosphate cytidylyltransferase
MFLDPKTKLFLALVGGGQGSRMGQALPKQFQELAGKPVFIHALEAFQRAFPEICSVVMLPKNYLELGAAYIRKYYYAVAPKVALIEGGASRTLSVWQGLQYINRLLAEAPDEGSSKSLVAIHDAARPLVTPALIQKAFKIADQYGSAISALPITFSIRKKEGERTVSLNREQFLEVQTPQVFVLSLIWEAYQKFHGADFSDDASIYEAAGYSPYIIEGEKTNLKITFAQDLRLAETLLKSGL